MTRIKIFIICFAAMVSLLPMHVVAQRRSLFQRIDSLLDIRDQRSKLDTNYVSRPDKHWTFRLINNVSGTNFTIKIKDLDNQSYNFRFKDPIRHTVTLGANYRGLAVALAFNPSKLFGKKTSTEINVNAYGNRFGLDFIYENNGLFDGEIKVDGTTYVVEDDIREKSLTINGYYAFNGRKFSYPAAFSQSYIQKRSAGSLMAGLSYHRSSVTLVPDEDVAEGEFDNEVIKKVKMSYASAGVGYGYNFVPNRNWLLHISTLPTLVFWSENKLIKMIGTENMETSFPEFSIVGRASVVHYFKHFFMAATVVYNYTSAGDYDFMRLQHHKWRARLIIGKRF